jgi:hypothetical protein
MADKGFFLENNEKSVPDAGHGLLAFIVLRSASVAVATGNLWAEN